MCLLYFFFFFFTSLNNTDLKLLKHQSIKILHSSSTLNTSNLNSFRNKFQFSILSSQNKSKSIASKTLYRDLTLLIITSKPIISLMTDLKSGPKIFKN